jgi:SAM-dependent methyltransferase
MKFGSKSIENVGTTREGFTKIYAETNPPWDIGKPQPPFVAVADQVVSPVLDSGCGTGGTSLYFASLGHTVTGIDFVEEAIGRARAKAAARDLAIDFQVKDAMTLGEWDERFASVIDSGLFHIYAGDERKRYVQGTGACSEAGRAAVPVQLQRRPGLARGRSVAAGAVRGLRRCDWEIESLELADGEVNPAFEAESPGHFAGKKMWFAVIRRKGAPALVG